MIVLRDIYENEDICIFDNETDAFEIIMSLVEEKIYETFQFYYLRCGNAYEDAQELAAEAADEFIERLYFQEVPYVKGNSLHLRGNRYGS